jgi:hypothetical protein
MARRSRNAEAEGNGGTEEAGSAEREGMKDVLKKMKKEAPFSRSCAAGRAETAASW